VASSSARASDGLCNERSTYGSPRSSTSIWNTRGDYGSERSALSAYNPRGDTPPRLACEEPDAIYFLNPVSVNDRLAGAIHPDTLCLTLEDNGY
jgi:hypothetical protein